MKLSIMVPVYNLENYIGPCLESLLTQQVDFNYQIIVANDCSTDDSKSVIDKYCRQYPEKVQLIDNQTNLRLAKNMQALLARCEGEYIAYMDGDDLAMPDKLQKQVDYLNANPDCGMVYHDSEVFNSDTDVVSSHYVRDYYNRQYIPEKADITHLVRYGSFFNASSLMFRRHDFLQETVDERCKIILDHPFQVLNAGFTQGKIGRIESVLGRYRLHSDSFGAQTLQDASRREQVLADQLQAISNASRFGVEHSTILAGEAHYYFATALFFLKRKEQSLFKKYIVASFNESGYFDQRHQYVYENQEDMDKCRTYLNFV